MSTKRRECNDRTGGRSVIDNHPAELEWLRNWAWKYWVTLTFSSDPGRDKADAILNDFLNDLEAALRDSLTCMIGQEQKTISGSGKPAGRVHFHLLIGSAANLNASTIASWWQLPKFGGSRTAAAGAHVEVYDPRRGAISYLLKFRQDPAWDVRYRNLELLSPLVPASAATSSRMRRKLRRCSERKAGAVSRTGSIRPSATAQKDLEPVPSKPAISERRGCLEQHRVRETVGVGGKAGTEVRVRSMINTEPTGLRRDLRR